MLLSILVISRSSNLINSLLKSISNATTLDKENVEPPTIEDLGVAPAPEIHDEQELFA